MDSGNSSPSAERLDGCVWAFKPKDREGALAPAPLGTELGREGREEGTDIGAELVLLRPVTESPRDGTADRVSSAIGMDRLDPNKELDTRTDSLTVDLCSVGTALAEVTEEPEWIIPV